MRIQRDYNRPFFRRSRRGAGTRFLFLYGIILGALLVFVATRYDELQLEALEMVGMAPTATPYASQLAAWGMEEFQRGDIQAAMNYFERAVQQHTDDVNYLYEYGVLLLENDLFDKTIEVADHAIEVAPQDPRGYALKGRALMWSDPSAAVQITTLGLDFDATYAPLYAVQGVAYTNLFRFQQAITQATKAIELDPTDPFVLRAISTPLILLGRYGEAIDYLERAISINPNMTAPYFELASLYRNVRVNQPEMAVALYYEILEMEPNNAKAYLRLCQTYAAVDEARFDVAQPYCDTAIELDPEYGDAYAQRGQMQYSRRNYEGSIESFETCIAEGSTRIECWYVRGFAHYRLGQCDQAWSILEEARPMAVEDNLPSIVEQIDNVMDAMTEKCANYRGRAVPTLVPATEVPPTPIGGFG